MKKTLKIVIIPFIVILCISIYILYLTKQKQNCSDALNKIIKENYKLNEKITYSNEYNNYYILTTKNRVIVLNNEYSEILNESIDTIQKKGKDQELIYKTNKLMFEETVIKDNNLIYKYYSANNGKFIKETIMEKQ